MEQHLIQQLMVRSLSNHIWFPQWLRCSEEYKWAAMVEDGAPGHRGHFEKYRELNGMVVLVWPVQSPEFNLIEILWRNMEVE